ncbi:8998_t:CDS:2 [Ambispora gerdemannii]|uniref:8998_t:CDS:1 n=1 Tax=Ambispora gerdemannii TaxID=144530 RepID=A0A9N9G6U0_9GLOM|nr:8998_t:CDS:2 [Ambispora gerdemannii]
MGGCCSSQTILDDTVGREGTADNLVPRGGNKPFTKKGVKWTSNIPINQRRLKMQRDAFWDTAPSYEGRLEIWQALRCACESEDLILAQAIIDSANITIPTGNLTNGCYDELGNRYVIPVYCIVEPVNLIKESDSEGGTSSHQADDNMDSKLLSESAASVTTTDDNTFYDHNLTVRLSNHAKDVRISVNLKQETIGTLRQKLCANEELDGQEFNARFFFLGRMLDDDTKLADVKFEEGQVLQALITEKS